MQTQTSGEVEERLKVTEGFKLFCRHWSSAKQAEKVVIFLHGIEVHSGAFRFMGQELANANCEVYAFDRRGFGNSKEPILPRGDTLNFERHLEDLNEVVQIVRKNYSGKELFIFGHSIGCAYAFWYAAHYSLLRDGLILAAPPVEAGFKLPAQNTLKIVFSPIVSHHLMYNLVDKWPKAFKESEEYKPISEVKLKNSSDNLFFAACL